MQLTFMLTVFLILAACSRASGNNPGLPVVLPFASQTPVAPKASKQAPARTKPPVQSPTRSPVTPTPTQPPVVTEDEDNEPIIFPTPTPLVPTPVIGKEYEIVDWTPERANQLINEMQAYPDGLGYFDLGYHRSSYYFSFGFARLAEAEALLQFPNSSFAKAWKWDQAYNMALIGEPQVIDAYAELLLHALNSEKIQAGELESWFKKHEPRLQLTLTSLTPPSGYATAYLAEIADEQRASGIYLWVVGKASYQVFPLRSCDETLEGYNPWCENGDFGFSSANGINYTLKDVTGDGIADIITEHYFFPGSGDARTTNFNIFDVHTIPPRKIEYDPPLPLRGQRTWEVSSKPGQAAELRFDFIFDSYVCPFIRTTQDYQLAGGKFLMVDQNGPKPNEVDTIDHDLGCKDFYFDSLLFKVWRGEKYILDDVERWLADWPYSNKGHGIWMGETSAPDDRDGARFTLGFYLALNGRREEAIREMQTILSNPVIPSSRWMAIANEFLDHYPPSGDLQQACMATRICLQLLGEPDLISLYRYHAGGPTILEYLQANSVPIIASGALDLNQDGWKDYWFTEENPDNSGMDVSLLLYWKGHFKNFDLGWSQEEVTPQIEISTPYQDQPALMVRLGNDITQYILYQSDDGTVLLTTYPDYLKERVASAVDDAESKLLAGRPAADVFDSLRITSLMVEELHKLQLYNRFYGSDPLPRWYYWCGLVNELEGNTDLAVQDYTTAWKDFPNSPYALMAKAKLQPAP
jgi:hypothetical protein